MKKEETKDWKNLKTFLCRQKYPNGLWLKPYEMQKKLPISKLRKVTRDKIPGKSPTEIPFVVTHNPKNHNIFNTTRYNYLPVLHRSKTLTNIRRVILSPAGDNHLTYKKSVKRQNFHQQKKCFWCRNVRILDVGLEPIFKGDKR